MLVLLKGFWRAKRKSRNIRRQENLKVKSHLNIAWWTLSSRVPIAYIDIRVFAHATEDTDKVLNALHNTLPTELTDRVFSMGNPLGTYSTRQATAKRLHRTVQPYCPLRLAGSVSVWLDRRGTGICHPLALDLQQRTPQYGIRRDNSQTKIGFSSLALYF